jgi:hypothetical protein
VALSYDDTTQKAKLDALDTMVGTSPLLRIYSGTPPATANAALSGNTLLAELAMSATAFGAAAGSGTVTKTANSITSDSSADATGTATFFRIYKSDGTTCRIQGSVGTSGADLNLNSTSITSGGTVAVSSLVITAAND